MNGTEKKCMLMFSGGCDSTLCVPKLVSSSKSVSLITFDNGVERELCNATKTAERLRKIYGESVELLGIESITGLWRKLLIPYFLGEWGDIQLLPAEMICLTCRTAMYARAVIECLRRGIRYLAEGARKSQGYPEQQPQVVEKYKQLCKRFSIELLLPVWAVGSKREVKESLTIAGIIPKVAEPFCTLAMPLYDYQAQQANVEEMGRVLDELIFPNIEGTIGNLQRDDCRPAGEKEI